MPGVFSPFDLEPGPNVQLDGTGVPLVRIWSTGEFSYNPTSIAQWGLGASARYSIDRSPLDRERMLKAADWLVGHQTPNGGFPLTFDHFHPNPKGYKLKAPWYSAISQGNAISLLIRAYQDSGDAKYRRAAERALLIFDVSPDEGGVRGHLNGLPWYEETPDPRDPNHILNGFVFALIGVHDLYLATSSPFAERLWKAGEQSLRSNLAEFVVHSAPEDPSLPMPWSVYDLQHRSLGSPPNYVTDFYMGIHIALLREMARRTERLHYTQVADQWEHSLAEYKRTH